MTNPTTTPINESTKNSETASLNTKWPVRIAANANLNTVSDAASFTKLSPSRIVKPLFGIFIPFNTDDAATASGGEMIPPNKNPNARVKSGIMLTEKYAIASDVKKVRPKPIDKIERRHFQKLFQEVPQAASKSNGGRNIKKTISGLILTSGTTGMNEINKPPITKRMGYEMDIL